MSGSETGEEEDSSDTLHLRSSRRELRRLRETRTEQESIRREVESGAFESAVAEKRAKYWEWIEQPRGAPVREMGTQTAWEGEEAE